MGNLCAQNLREVDQDLIVNNICFIKTFRSKNDKYFDNIFNYLQYLTINEFLQFIYTIEPDQGEQNLVGNKSYYREVPIYQLPILFKTKLLNHPLVVNFTDERNVDFRRFTNFYSKYFDNLYKNYKSLYKNIFNHKLRESVDCLPKLVLIPLAFHACSQSTPNSLKLEIFFNLLCDNGELKKDSSDLFIFLYFMFVCPTNVSLLSLNDLAEEDDDVRKYFPEDIFYNLYSSYELKDSRDAVQDFINNLFGDKDSLDYSQFERNMLDKSLYFIFSETGVRQILDEKHAQQAK